MVSAIDKAAAILYLVRNGTYSGSWRHKPRQSVVREDIMTVNLGKALEEESAVPLPKTSVTKNKTLLPSLRTTYRTLNCEKCRHSGEAVLAVAKG